MRGGDGAKRDPYGETSRDEGVRGSEGFGERSKIACPVGPAGL